MHDRQKVGAMSSSSPAPALGTDGTRQAQNPTGSAVAAAAVLAEAVSIAAHAEAAVAAQAAADARAAEAEASAGAAEAAARAEAAAAAAVAAVDAAAVETASASSAAVFAEADLSAATTAMAAAHAAPGIQVDHQADDRVEAALLAATTAAVSLAAAVQGENEARSVAAVMVEMAVTVAAAAAALTASANAAATRDEVTAAAVLAATITAVLAASVTAAQDTQAEAVASEATGPDRATWSGSTAKVLCGPGGMIRRIEPAPSTVTRLTGLLDGLDDAARQEWDQVLSAPIPPTSLPGRYGNVEAAGSTSGGLYGLARDLMLARRIELALSQTVDRTEVTFAAAPVALFHADFDGHQMIRFSRVNPAMCALTGYTEAELLTLDARALSHPGDDAVQSDVGENRYRPSDDREEVLRWMHAQGHSMWVRLKLRPVLDDDGVADQVVGQVEDVTAIRRVEAALRGSEAQFRSAFDDAPVPMMLIELTGPRPATLLHANAALSRLTGHTEAELQASDFPALLGQSLTWTGTGTLPAGDYQAFTRHRHADGHSFLARCDSHLVPGSQGEPDTLVVVLQEIPRNDPDELSSTFDTIA